MKKVPPVVWFLARIFLGAVFAYAGLFKLIEPAENFRGVIAQYQVIPYFLIPVVASVFPWFEFIFGVFLIVGFAPRVSALILGLMSLSLLLVLGASNVLLGAKAVSCGCFGEHGLHLTVRQVFALDLVNMAIGFKLYSQREHFWSLDTLLKK